MPTEPVRRLPGCSRISNGHVLPLALVPVGHYFCNDTSSAPPDTCTNSHFSPAVYRYLSFLYRGHRVWYSRVKSIRADRQLAYYKHHHDLRSTSHPQSGYPTVALQRPACINCCCVVVSHPRYYVRCSGCPCLYVRSAEIGELRSETMMADLLTRAWAWKKTLKSIAYPDAPGKRE